MMEKWKQKFRNKFNWQEDQEFMPDGPRWSEIEGFIQQLLEEDEKFYSLKRTVIQALEDASMKSPFPDGLHRDWLFDEYVTEEGGIKGDAHRKIEVDSQDDQEFCSFVYGWNFHAIPEDISIWENHFAKYNLNLMVAVNKNPYVVDGAQSPRGLYFCLCWKNTKPFKPSNK